MKAKISEAKNLDAILDLLNKMNIPHVRITNTGIIYKRDNKFLFGRRKYDQKGAPDIIIAYRGWPIAVEVKSSIGKAKPEQMEWLKKWEEKGGGIWIIATDAEQVFGLLDGLKKRSEKYE